MFVKFILLYGKIGLVWNGHALTLICEELRISVPVRWLVCSGVRCHKTGGDAFRCGDVHILCLQVSACVYADTKHCLAHAWHCARCCE